jgi:hypothetical protein
MIDLNMKRFSALALAGLLGGILSCANKIQEAEPANIDISNLNWQKKIEEKKRSNQTLAEMRNTLDRVSRIESFLSHLGDKHLAANYSSIDLVKDIYRQLEGSFPEELNGKIIRRGQLTFPEDRAALFKENCQTIDLRSETVEIVEFEGTKTVETTIFTHQCLTQGAGEEVILLQAWDNGSTFSFQVNQEFLANIIKAPSVIDFLPLDCQKAENGVQTVCRNLSLGSMIKIDLIEMTEKTVHCQASISVDQKRLTVEIDVDEKGVWRVRVPDLSWQGRYDEALATLKEYLRKMGLP